MVRIEDLETGAVFDDNSSTSMPATASMPATTSMPATANFATAAIERIKKHTNTHISVGRYIELFGAPTPVDPWGSRLWIGMEEALALHPHRMQVTPFVPCHFTLPEMFSKAAAMTPTSLVNPSSAAKYPAFALALDPDGDWWKVCCFNMLLELSRPWRVHRSHLTFFWGAPDSEEEVEV